MEVARLEAQVVVDEAELYVAEAAVRACEQELQNVRGRANEKRKALRNRNRALNVARQVRTIGRRSDLCTTILYFICGKTFYNEYKMAVLRIRDLVIFTPGSGMGFDRIPDPVLRQNDAEPIRIRNTARIQPIFIRS
jgi:hypothetical protein